MVAPLVAAAGISAASSLAGGILGQMGNDKAARENWENQKALAQQGIEWRVRDAKRAGIHPLYALGAPTFNASPTNIGGSPLGEAIAQGGADISRAVLQTGTSNERLDALAVENAKLNNDLLRAQIASQVKQNFASPPFPNGKMNNDTFLPIPDRSGGGLKVRHPGLAQEAENNYGEIGGEIFGGLALISDADEAFNGWMINTFGIDPRNYTPFALAARTGPVVDRADSWLGEQYRAFRDGASKRGMSIR